MIDQNPLVQPSMIRSVVPDETATLIRLADDTGIFHPGEAEALMGGVLDELHSSHLGAGHEAHACLDGSSGLIVGWAYFGPTANANGVWDLWWIGVTPTRQSQGFGSRLLRFVEDRVRSFAGRLLIVETSSLPTRESVRRFYRKHLFTECGTVPDFYAAGDGKVIFAKRIAAANSD